jgi:poly(A) polymerase
MPLQVILSLIVLIRYGTDKNGKPVKKAVIYTKSEHGIPKEKIDSDALRIIERLRDAGFNSYIVGGAVRDLLVGNVPKDFDIVTDATPSRIKKIFRNSRIIGRRFRLVHVLVGPKIFEVSTFRSTVDGSVGNEFGSMDEDVRRRDFTLNALYYDPLREQVIDYVGGVRDIRKHVLRPVISIDRIFIEDPVRMLRAVKYSATTNAKMSFALRRKIRRSANLLSDISPSRLTEELLKIINSGHSYDIVREALETDLYMYLQPAATARMYADRSFENAYMANLKKLDQFCAAESDTRLGRKLVFLITDFVGTLTDWKKEVTASSSSGELYTRTWNECRRFVLPMNPQRSELEFAVRTVLTSLGIGVRMPRRRHQTKQPESVRGVQKI